jgi:hypothetical protein
LVIVGEDEDVPVEAQPTVVANKARMRIWRMRDDTSKAGIRDWGLGISRD